ncbi:MAG: acyl carrier protein [Acidimicrobiia bacterium]|uniref:phosphopantetheine-binding protein n=1 Tax=Candidatus Spongiisocius sp. TaxID=3101273 RepID=UPI0013865602|nr:acyl carrier protein [Acidimicrobiia bacterium]MYB45783.1 acyl carrier protein [Acidimicrobiia bacterium]MYC85341.1 acyl carrier protein [Acidimicrobiia bacterium]
MASTAERLTTLVNENIEVDGQPLSIPDDLNISLIDSGVSSMDIVALAKLVSQEFSVEFTVEECTSLKTLSEVVGFLDGKAA